MKLQKELDLFIKFCKCHEEEITNFFNKVKESRCYVNSPVDYTAFEVVRYYCREIYNEKTYCILYNKYDADDKNVLSFAKAGLKAIDIK